MSTRCSIHFTWGGDEVVANVYRHADGYPTENGVLGDLDKFFAAVEEQCGGDTRFNDPSYLAAKFVVWQAGENAYDFPPLAFRGVGVQVQDPADIDFRYRVDCRTVGRPTVMWQRSAESGWHVSQVREAVQP